MGYDMTWVESGSSEVLAGYNAARERYEAAVAARDAKFGAPPFVSVGEFDAIRASVEQQAVEGAWKEMYLADPTYFRLNIWGMAICRDVMFERGMLDVEAMPAFPTPEQFGLDRYPPSPDDEYPPDTAEGRFVEAHWAVIEGDAGGPIPAYKLSSNERWLVTPAEILRSLEAFVRSGAEEKVIVRGRGKPVAFEAAAARIFGQPHLLDADDELRELTWWPGWIDFLVGASEHGGFRVY